MVDLHTHLLYNVDDGAVDLIESIEMLKNAESAGYSVVVATPHYIEGSYTSKNADKVKIIDEIRNEIKTNNINVKVYLGNEVFMTENVEALMNNNEINSINGTKYLLVELPRFGGSNGLQGFLFKIFSSGYIPIVAHPERYSFVQKDPNVLIDLIEQGVIFQLNSASILGHYGKKVAKAAKILIKNNMIHLVATDTHSSRSSNYMDINTVKNKIKRNNKNINLEDLFFNNPMKILKNEKIQVVEPKIYKKGILTL